MANMYRHVYDSDFKPTTGIGSFAEDRNDGFKAKVKECMESFQDKYRMNPMQNMLNIASNATLWQDYKDRLFEDVLPPSSESSFDHYASNVDEYTAMNRDKMDQMIENSRQMMVDEASSVGMLSPIVAATMPVLKKEYILNQFKDMLHTIVTDTTIIKYAYERRFLKDAAGNKKFFPECFYDGSYKDFTDQSIGKVINKAFNATVGGQLVQFDVLQASGGSLSKRDALGNDFSVDGIKVTVPSDADPAGEVVELTGLDVRPDFATKTFNNTVEIPSKVAAVEATTEIYLYGTVDFYSGIVNIAVSSNNTNIDLDTVFVQFGGHLSNANNDAIIELDKLRENRQFTISEKERFNAGLTIERIKEEKALANIDVTVEMVSDMSDVSAQTADSNIQRFLEDSFNDTQAIEQTRVFQPMGYNFQFADAFEFDLEAPGPYMVPESEWRSKQIRFYFERVLAYLKTKLRDERIMFSVSANTYVMEMLTATDSDIKWVLNQGSNVGGVQLDYKFGVTTVNGTRVQFISTQKETIEKGFRITIIPLTDTVITYRQYQFSFNIETNYRNPITPNIPNIMTVQRYENVSVLPIQSNYFIKQYREGNLGTSPQEVYKQWISVHQAL
jgi:hypothetical protein